MTATDAADKWLEQNWPVDVPYASLREVIRAAMFEARQEALTEAIALIEKEPAFEKSAFEYGLRRAQTVIRKLAEKEGK